MEDIDPQPQQPSSGLQKSAPPPPPPGTPVIADVHVDQDGNRLEFALEWRFEGEKEPRPQPIDIPQKKSGQPGTTIHFHLHDRTRRGFAFDPVDPIWVSRNECPKDWSEDPEIPASRIDRHPKLLTVFDTNEDACELRFALVFEDREGNREPYDPAIRNGGTI